MSRFTQLARSIFHIPQESTVASALSGYIGSHEGEIREIAQEAVSMLALSSSAAGLDKRVIAREIVTKGVKAAFGVTLPDRVVDFLVQEAVILVLGAEKKPAEESPAAP